jgi:cell division protein FtsQ
MSKIIDINDRVPARKRRRKLRTNIKFTVLLTIFLFAILSLLYFQSSYSKIQQINISGNVLLDEQSYLNLSGINLNDSMWGFKSRDIVEKIEQQDWVQDVVVERKLLTTVTITIKEWPKVAYIEQQQLLYPILENGYVFDKNQVTDPIDAPLFINFSDEKIRRKIVKQLAKLKPEVLALISQVNSNATESDPYGIILYMNDGYEVRAEISTFASKLNYYPSIVAQIEQQEAFEKGIIDIEVGSYYRPFSGEYQSLSLAEEEQMNEESSSQSEQSSSVDGDDSE